MDPGIEQLLDRLNTVAARTRLNDEDHRNFREVINAAYVLDRTFSGQDLKEWLTAEGWPSAAIDELVDLFEYC